MDLVGYLNGIVVGEDRRLLDTIAGTEDEAWLCAMDYARVLRKELRVADLLVSVEEKRKGRLYYLYLEAERAA